MFGAADLHDTIAGGGEVAEVVFGIEKGDGIGGATGGAGKEDGAELLLEPPADAGGAGEQGAENRRGPASKDGGIGDEDEVARALGMFWGIDQVGLGGEGDAPKIVERADGIGRQVMIAEEVAIIGGERKHDALQVSLKLAGLTFEDVRFR
jgi:hypothetical protein